MPTRSDYLADIPLFALLDEQERASLAERLDEAEGLPAGTTIFEERAAGRHALRRRGPGEVEIFFKNDTGHKILLEVAKPGGSARRGSPPPSTAAPAAATAHVTRGRRAPRRRPASDLDQFLRASPAAALDLLTATGKRLRETNEILRHTASRHVTEVVEDTRTAVMKTADWISDFSGSLPFLFIHCLIFFVWIVLNTGPLSRTGLGGWDPFPYGLLTMVVSLEAIILSVFVLLSQNRQVARERVRNDIEYQVNLKAELEVAELHRKLDGVHADILGRLARIEKATTPR